MALLIACVVAAGGFPNQADQYFKQGQAAQAKGDSDAALDLYLKAL